MEQFLRTLAPDVRVWMREHNPHTGQRAAELVDNFLAARQGRRSFRLLPDTVRSAAGGRQEWVSHSTSTMYLVQDGRLKVCCVHGDKHEYPTAEVYLEVDGQAFQISVGVVDRLGHPVVLGQDILVLPEVVQACKPVCMVATRSQSRAQAPEPLVSDEPTQTDVLEHDIDVGDSETIRQHCCRVPLEKREILEGEVQYFWTMSWLSLPSQVGRRPASL
ncbi:hypothetical protein ACEWY4_010280 [Coilia grayii]|uniref:SCAN box domain-containing protein n=1 Tax=Coilia grayii TaxID=363190 RepID=A0ABD1K1H4_9TELE